GVQGLCRADADGISPRPSRRHGSRSPDSGIGQPFVDFGQPRSKPGEPQKSSRDTLTADRALHCGGASCKNGRPAVTQLITILKFALPGAIAIATLEALFLAVVMRKNYNWRAYFASLADALGREYIVMSFLTISLAAPIIGFAWKHRLFTIPLDTPTAVVVLVIGQD